MRTLLDTHFLLRIVLEVPRIDEFPWLDDYRPWGVSPVTFLEVAFLAEVGRLEARLPELVEAVGRDPRFTVDEIPLVKLMRGALPLEWTRDPFDRLLATRGGARRVPLCTLDRRLRTRHRFVVAELDDQ